MRPRIAAALLVLATIASSHVAQAQSGRRRAPASQSAPSSATTSPPAHAASSPSPSSAASAPAPAPRESAHTIANNSLWHMPGRHSHDLDVEIAAFLDMGVWAWAWGGYAVGPSFRLGIPLLENGPISGRNNDLRLNFGIIAMIWPGPPFYFWLASPIAVQWNFYLTDRWSVMLNVGALIDLYPADGPNCYDHPQYYCDKVDIRPLVGIGARLHSGHGGYPALTIRLEYPTGLNVGVAF